jgi:CRP-like cAMP-binding protein
LKKIPRSVKPDDPPTDSGGRAINNKILLALPPKVCQQVISKLEFVRLKLHQILHEAGETIKSCYFVDSGVISILAVQSDGKSVEVGLIGSEGFVGLPLLVDYRTSPTRAVTQADGTAYRCEVQTLRYLISQYPEMTRLLHRFGQQLAMQTTQIAACNRLHEVEERLARWILMFRDRQPSDSLPLTQEFLGQMLGTRRASVTIAAGALQRAGMISYTRGRVRILNRQALEQVACDCYQIVQRQLRDWKMESP